jgi:hypothetical protein
MPFWRREKSVKSVWFEYGKAYELRPRVPVESIYPLINDALDIAFRFSPLGAQLMYTGGLDWDRAADEFEKEYKQLGEALRSLEAVGVAVSEKHMMLVHMATEVLLQALVLYYYEDAQATQARIKQDEKAFRKRYVLAQQYWQAVSEAKSKALMVVRQLRSERPDQFQALGLSENNLIDLGGKDLVEQ